MVYLFPTPIPIILYNYIWRLYRRHIYYFFVYIYSVYYCSCILICVHFHIYLHSINYLSIYPYTSKYLFASNTIIQYTCKWQDQIIYTDDLIIKYIDLHYIRHTIYAVHCTTYIVRTLLTSSAWYKLNWTAHVKTSGYRSL